MAKKQKNSWYAVPFLAMGVALLTICSWITVPFVISFTMQTFAVFFIAAVLRPSQSISVILTYIGLGLLGVPVFSGFQAGPSVLAGITGGYLAGFIPAALLIGGFVRKWGQRLSVMIGSMALGLLICYFCGALWYIILYSPQQSVSVWAALVTCVFPFILPDCFKIALAIFLVRKTRPIFYRFHSFLSGGHS